MIQASGDPINSISMPRRHVITMKESEGTGASHCGRGPLVGRAGFQINEKRKGHI